MTRIDWGAAEIRIALVERRIDVKKAPKRREFSVYPEFGNPKTRFVQALDSALPGPLVWLWAEMTDGTKTCPVPFGSTISADPARRSPSPETVGDSIAGLVDALLARSSVSAVLVRGSDAKAWELEVKCVDDAGARDPLGDVADGSAPHECGNSGKGLRDEF